MHHLPAGVQGQEQLSASHQGRRRGGTFGKIFNSAYERAAADDDDVLVLVPGVLTERATNVIFLIITIVFTMLNLCLNCKLVAL